MRPFCGRTIKGAIAWVSFNGFLLFLFRLFMSWRQFSLSCTDVTSYGNEVGTDGESECTKRFWIAGGIFVAASPFLYIAFVLIRRGLVRRF